MSSTREILLEYYKRELTYLRKMGAEFAAQYPKIAGRLELGIGQCPDPHIERLMESFAFLTARIQYNLESEFPRISTALLQLLYPQFVAPIPSMAIARFDVDPDQGKLTTGHLIPKHSPLFARTPEMEICRFRTCYPVTLWPVEIDSAEFVSTDKYSFLDYLPQVSLVLKIRIKSLYKNFTELSLKTLRFYINADRMLAGSLYELLFCNVLKVALLPEKQKRPVYLSKDSLLPVGFGSDEDVLPYPENAHFAYRLLHEYFTFPRKFLFFDVDGIDNFVTRANEEDTWFDILFMIDKVPATRMSIDKDTFCLGCTPIINLFPKTSDPVRIDETKTEYRINPDERREKICEIHSILSVSASTDPAEKARVVKPFFSYDHQMDIDDHRTFWYARRQDTGRKDLPGTEIYMTFLDLDFNPKLPPESLLYAHTLCTNRYLAEQIPAGAILQIEKQAPLARISTLRKPTSQLDPPLEGPSVWRLISHLSLNYLSLSHPEGSLKALKEILLLYNFTDKSGIDQQISGIREMECKKVVRRMGKEAWRGFCQGMEITLTFDERLYVGTSAFLLASVLSRFFSLYTSVNSFTRLVIKSLQREGVWKKWPPMAGEMIIH